MNGAGFLIAAYLGAALLYGLYLFWLRRRERVLERTVLESTVPERTVDGRGR